MTDNCTKYVGLGRYNETSEITYINHNGGEYDKLNEREMFIPVEHWLDFYKRLGFWIENVNVEVLLKIIATPLDDPFTYYKTEYFGLYYYPHYEPSKKQPVIFTCRSAVRNAFIKERLIKEGNLGLNDQIVYRDEKMFFL